MGLPQVFENTAGILQSTSVVHLGSLDPLLPEALGLGGSLGAGPLDADPRL